MAHVALVGTSTITSGSLSAVTITTAVPAGSTVIGGVVWESSAGTIPTGISATDTRGNTWAVDISAGGASNVTAAGSILRARITTALQAGDTITVSITGGTRSRWAVQFDSFDDVNTSPLDQTQHNDNATATSLTTNATGVTAQTYELAYAVFGFAAVRTFSLTAGWSGTAQVNTAAGSSDRALQCIYRYTSATGAQTGTGTLNSSAVYCAAIATYKATYIPVVVPGASSLSAAGTQTVSGRTRERAVAGVAGTASLAVAGIVRERATASASAAASLNASGRVQQRAVSALPATSAIAATGRVGVRAVLALAAVSGLTTAAAVHETSAAALAASGSLSGSGTLRRPGQAAFAAAGSTSAAGQTSTTGAGHLTASGALAALGRTATVGSTALAGAGALHAAGVNVTPGSAGMHAVTLMGARAETSTTGAVAQYASAALAVSRTTVTSRGFMRSHTRQGPRLSAYQRTGPVISAATRSGSTMGGGS